MSNKMDKREFNWGRDGLVRTTKFLKDHSVNWKNVDQSIQYGIVTSTSVSKLNTWLNYMLEYQSFVKTRQAKYS